MLYFFIPIFEVWHMLKFSGNNELKGLFGIPVAETL